MNDNQKEIKIGTLLFNTRYNIVGVVNEIYNRGGFDNYNLWYGVDNDDDYYWISAEVKVIDEKEFLFRKLKNDERMGCEDEDNWIPFK